MPNIISLQVSPVAIPLLRLEFTNDVEQLKKTRDFMEDLGMTPRVQRSFCLWIQWALTRLPAFMDEVHQIIALNGEATITRLASKERASESLS